MPISPSWQTRPNMPLCSHSQLTDTMPSRLGFSCNRVLSAYSRGLYVGGYRKPPKATCEQFLVFMESKSPFSTCTSTYACLDLVFPRTLQSRCPTVPPTFPVHVKHGYQSLDSRQGPQREFSYLNSSRKTRYRRHRARSLQNLV